MLRNTETWRWPLKALPEVVVAGHFPLEDRAFGYQYQSRTHALHLYAYHGQIRIGERTYPLRPGDVTLTPAGSPSAYDLPAQGHHWCIHFERLPLRGSTVDLPVHFSVGSLHEFAIGRVRAIARLHTQGSGDASHAALVAATSSAALQELLLWLAMQAQTRPNESRDNRSLSAVARVAAIIHNRFTEPLTVPELADEVEITQNYLARVFRRRFAMTIPRYLLTRRIEYARHLLMTTNIPVSRVAVRVGIPDPQHFNKQFRKLTGTSPSMARIDSRG